MQKFVCGYNFHHKYGVFYGINAGLFNWNETRLCTDQSTEVGGITPHQSPLFKRERNVVVDVILLHSFQVRPSCVVVSSLLQNPEVLDSSLVTDESRHFSITVTVKVNIKNQDDKTVKRFTFVTI